MWSTKLGMNSDVQHMRRRIFSPVIPFVSHNCYAAACSRPAGCSTIMMATPSSRVRPLAPSVSCLKHQTADMKQVEFVFKARALHCTPLEFRAGLLAGGLLIWKRRLLVQTDNQDSDRDRGDASISRISAAFQLLILTFADDVMNWLLWSAVSWCARHWHLRLCRAIASTSTTWIYI